MKELDYLMGCALQLRTLEVRTNNPLFNSEKNIIPLLFDARKFLRDYELRQRVCKYVEDIIDDNGIDIKEVVGIDSGISFGASLADRLHCPYNYLSESSNNESSILPDYKRGASGEVIVVSDVVLTARNIVARVSLLSEHVSINKLFSLFSYGFAKKFLARHKIHDYPVFAYEKIIEYAKSKNYFTDAEVSILNEFERNPRHYLKNLTDK